MAQDFSRTFYNSQEWKRARKAYWKQCGGLCDLCRKEGLYTPAEIIHHIVPLTPDNINDPAIRTGTENLQALCRRHHALIHEGGPRRYVVDQEGHVVTLEDGQGIV